MEGNRKNSIYKFLAMARTKESNYSAFPLPANLAIGGRHNHFFFTSCPAHAYEKYIAFVKIVCLIVHYFSVE